MKVVLLGLLSLVGICCGRELPHDTRSSPMQSINATLSQDPCRRELLISIEVKGSETWITSFSKGNGVNQDSSIPQVQTSGKPKKLSGRISRGCGDKYFRCRDLLVETILTNEVSFETTHILFVPLEDRVQLVELTVSNDSTVRFGAEYGVRQSTQMCNPSAMFKIGNSFYTACINFEENSVALYEIRLNTTSLSQSYMLSMADGEYNFRIDQNIANASNFLYMEWNYDTYIFFAINNTLYAIRPSEGSIDNDYEPIGASCRLVNKLALTGNGGEILAYCDRHLVYYSVDFADWTLQDTYDNVGRRYICPDSTLHLSVFIEENYITYNVDEWKKDIPVSNSILSGVCYGSTNHSLFAYIEEQEGLFLLDTLTASVHEIATISCLNMSCQPLLVAENRYLIIHGTDDGGGMVWVRDTSRNLSVIIEAQHTSPDLLTLVVDEDLKCAERNTENPVTEGDQVKMVVVVSLVPAIALALVGAGVITALIIGIVTHKQWQRLPQCLPVDPTPTVPAHPIGVPVTVSPIQEKNTTSGNSIQVGNLHPNNLERLSENEHQTPIQETEIENNQATTCASEEPDNYKDTEALIKAD